MKTNDEHQELVVRMRQGDTTALKLLLTETHDQLCRRLQRRIPPDVAKIIDVEDVAQEAHIEVFRHIDEFKSDDVIVFGRWVMAIGLNRLRNIIRHTRAKKRGGGRVEIRGASPAAEDSALVLMDALAGADQTPSRAMARGEAIEALEDALNALPEHYRQAVYLVHIEGCRMGEAAHVMGRTERAVQGLCRRGLRQLRHQLKRASRFLG
jgi:RNA polymerase sigma-70 factor (ECF subfamily)